MSGGVNIQVEGNTDTGGTPQTPPPPPPPPKESAIQKYAREVDGAGFKLLPKEEYNRLTATKKTFKEKFWEESPRAIWTIIVTAIITLCSFGYSWHKESKKTELVKLKAELKKELLVEIGPRKPT